MVLILLLEANNQAGLHALNTAFFYRIAHDGNRNNPVDLNNRSCVI